MKLTIASSIALLASAVSGVPTAWLEHHLGPRGVVLKRASVSDACDVGFCTQNGGTKGGAGGKTTTVSTYAELQAAASAPGPAIIMVRGNISGKDRVDVSSDKTIIGAAGSQFTGVGFRVKDAKNVILRNLKISKVSTATEGGDAIALYKATNVWVDHCDLSSDMNNGKDFYDGLFDVTHASDFVTVSNTKFHDHFKVSLVGHSDKNAAEDTGKLRVTYANNDFSNVGSRLPSIRFGQAHIFNNLITNAQTSGINTRMGAQVLVESSVFEDVKKPIASIDSKTAGGAVVNDVLGGTSSAPAGSLSKVPYSYKLLGSANVKAAVSSGSGQKLTF